MRLSERIAKGIGIDESYVTIIASRNNLYAKYYIPKKNGRYRLILQPSKEFCSAGFSEIFLLIFPYLNIVPHIVKGILSERMQRYIKKEDICCIRILLTFFQLFPEQC